MIILNIVILVEMSEPFVAKNVRDFRTNNLSMIEKKAWDIIQSEVSIIRFSMGFGERFQIVRLPWYVVFADECPFVGTIRDCKHT